MNIEIQFKKELLNPFTDMYEVKFRGEQIEIPTPVLRTHHGDGDLNLFDLVSPSQVDKLIILGEYSVPKAVHGALEENYEELGKDYAELGELYIETRDKVALLEQDLTTAHVLINLLKKENKKLTDNGNL